MAISSPGIGSNLDVNSIVSQLMAIERQPLTALARKEASFQAKLSGFGTLKGALSQFQTAVRSLSDISKFQGMRVTPADTAIATASATATAVAGTYALEVTQLAQAQKLATAGQASSTSAIGAGAATTLSFDFGTIAGGTFDSVTGKYTGAAFTSNGSGVKTVTIDASNNSLSGIRDAINKADIGVSASIVNDGGSSPYRLVLSAKATGQTQSLKLSVAGDATLSSLLSHNPADNTGQALAEKLSARNAEFKVDGIAVSKATNTISDVIQGVTLNLAKTNSGSPTNITVARDTAAVTAGVEAFVKAYNDISKIFKEAVAYDPDTRRAAILNGESSVRAIEAQVRSVLSAPVAGGAGAFTLLSQVGVSLQKDGLLALDNSKLQGAIDKNFSDIAALFAAAGKASDSLASYTSASVKTVPGAYKLEVTQLASSGKSVGSAAAGLTITAGSNDTLQVLLDGVSATVTLAPGTYASAAALAAEVQSKINGAEGFVAAGSSVTVTEAAGVLTLTSTRYGSASKASISGGNGMSSLMGAAAVVTDGLDVAGTINGVAATGTGQTLTGATGNAAEGLQVKVSGGATGSRGTVNYSQGYAYQFDKLMDTQLGTAGMIASRTGGIDTSLKSLAASRDRMTDRLAATEKRYRAQFTKLDVTISSMLSTGNFLTQQLANLSKNQ
ncbi:flagellar filament capping protein FliD [Polaromonas sp. AET17H-212]|uniref:flagellar filament capping protein FliD n=1 Tax=Polaromonas sp. AET17H-212 TaxID=1977061 RepID=UPI000BBC3B7F|nr:flagellar filament capping protein FliD [Polaromonas sp. AET17H-212]